MCLQQASRVLPIAFPLCSISHSLPPISFRELCKGEIKADKQRLSPLLDQRVAPSARVDASPAAAFPVLLFRSFPAFAQHILRLRRFVSARSTACCVNKRSMMCVIIFWQPSFLSELPPVELIFPLVSSSFSSLWFRSKCLFPLVPISHSDESLNRWMRYSQHRCSMICCVKTTGLGNAASEWINIFLISVCESTRVWSFQSSPSCDLQVRPRRRKTSADIFHHMILLTCLFLCNTSCNRTFLYHRHKETSGFSALTRKKPQSWAWTFSSFLSCRIKPRAEISSASASTRENQFWCMVTSCRSLKGWPLWYHWIANVSHVWMQTAILRQRSVSNSEVETETERRTSRSGTASWRRAGWLCSVSSIQKKKHV